MIELQNLTKTYGKFTAVDQVSLTIQKGSVMGLVGKSGSGKSTLGRLLLGLIAPTSGLRLWEGIPLKGLHPRRMQMVFQDPASSLNPRLPISRILEEPTLIHSLPNRTDELLNLVALSPAVKSSYPHQLSGGQKQRVAIARALALNPSLLICDEPLSSLDLITSSQILELLKTLQKELGLTILFIGHDLDVVRYLSDQIGVMESGKLLEVQATEQLFRSPLHPYTEKLLALRNDYIKLR